MNESSSESSRLSFESSQLLWNIQNVRTFSSAPRNTGTTYITVRYFQVFIVEGKYDIIPTSILSFACTIFIGRLKISASVLLVQLVLFD